MPGRLEKFAELTQFEIDEPSVRLLGYKYCRHNYVVVLGRVQAGGTEPITIGMLDIEERPLIEHLRVLLGRPILPVRLNVHEIHKALDMGYGVEAEPDSIKLTLQPTRRLSNHPSGTMTAMVDEILGKAVFLGASDVHIECYEDDVDVRYRIDGLLHQVNNPLSTANIRAAISRLKILASLDIAERFCAQEGRILASYETEKEERSIDFRISIIPGPFGEDAVLRVMDSSRQLVPLEVLGFSEKTLRQVEALVGNPEGLFVVNGPTGSGKTTTLYSLLNVINNSGNKILTVEDPIEYRFPKINQKQISSHMGFSDYARAFLRQDPDVLMIGEIRDTATAEVAVRAAQTGHLVLSTLHATDSVATVGRLQSLGVDHGLLADTLLGALAQRLVRKICPACREPSQADLRPRLGSAAAGLTHFRGRGCEACHQSGFARRVGVFELFATNQGLADMIAAGRPVHEIRRRARDEGMRLLVEDALEKVTSGTTTLDELLRVVPYRALAEISEGTG